MSHLKADLLWLGFNVEQWLQKQVHTRWASGSGDVPERFSSVSERRNVRIPMRDGVRLSADIYRPRTEGCEPLPVILTRMPYGKGEAYCSFPMDARYFAKRGYVCVVQDVRGRGASEGRFDPFVNEERDGWDTLEWISAQSWCDGNIGMTGESYFGYTQWAAAVSGHPSLKCISPGDTSADIYGEWVYKDHAFCLQTMGGWAHVIVGRRAANLSRFDSSHLPLSQATDATGQPSRTYTDWVAHAERDDYWRRIDLSHRYAEVAIPVLHWGGWYDVFLSGTLRDWQGMNGEGVQASVRARQHLVIGPTDHERTPERTGKVGRLRVDGQGHYWDRVVRFMDRWLKGGQEDRDAWPPVEFFVMGRNEWRRAEEWPLKETVYTDLYLHSGGIANTLDGDGVLSTEPPGDEQADHYIYDPLRPVDYWVGRDVWAAAKTMCDRRPVEQRTDVLVYTSDILDADLEVTGPIRAKLFAASSAVDTDFTVALADVFDDGFAQFVQEGIVRARYRDPEAAPSLLEPGRVYEFDVDVWATSYVFARGHRIRVEVSSSNFDRYDRNLNTGGDPGRETRPIKAKQTLLHDTEHPSRIVLPVIPERQGGRLVGLR